MINSEPHHLADYLYELSNLFNSMYQSENIIENKNEVVKYNKLKISQHFIDYSKLLMELLGLSPVDKMWNYKKNWEDIIHKKHIIEKDKLSEKSTDLFKLCCKNNTRGIAINPENDVAFPISTISFVTKFVGFSKNWKNINVIREIKITKITFTIRSLKVEL